MSSVKLGRGRTFGAILCLLGLTLSGAAARAAPAGPAAAPSSVRHFVSDAPLAQLFSIFCIKAFPDGAALDAALQVRSQAPLSAEQAKAYLADGPGRGWLIRTPDTLFAVTMADPPTPTCAVQEMTSDGVSDVAGFMEALKAHVTAIKGKLVAVAPQTAKPADGREVRYFGYGVLGADGAPVEQFGVYLSDYHGKVADPWTPYAGHGSGVEVRFTRTILAG